MRWLSILVVTFILAGCQRLNQELLDDPSVKLQKEITLTVGATVTERIPEIRLTATPSSTAEAASTITPVQKPDFQLCSPLADHVIPSLREIVSSPYDPPLMGKDDRHQGVDFAYYNHNGRVSIQGEEVTAILSGSVAAVIVDRLPYGNTVLLETPIEDLPSDLVPVLGMMPDESLYHLYAHLADPPLPDTGMWLDCGSVLGKAGATGYNIPVAHLHLETRLGPSGMRFDEMAYYDTQATEKEMAAYRLWRMSGVFRHFDPMVLFGLYSGLFLE